MESLQVQLDENIATALLAGLYASTDRFTASHTSAKSMTLSAQLIAAGARHQQVVKSLFSEAKEPLLNTQAQAEKNQQELKKLAELKNPEPQKQKSDPKPQIDKPKKAEPKPQADTKPTPPEVKEKPRVEEEGPAEDLEPEARVEFELPDHIKSGLANFLEK